MQKICITAILIALALSGSASAWTYDWTGATSNDWAVASNWGANEVPKIPGPAVNIYNGSAIIFSGSQFASDFTMTQVGGITTGDINLAIKPGASLTVNPYNFYVGYYTGAYKSVVNIEAGANISVAGGVVVGAGGSLARVNLAGQITAGSFAISGTNTKVDFALTGKLIINGNAVANFLDTSTWVTEGLITINGISKGQAGWPGLSAIYDAPTNKTTVTVAASAAGPDTAAWTGAVSNDWNVAGNWSGGLLPGWNTSVTVSKGNCIIYSGVVQIKDFTGMANGGTGDVHITVKNGASFNSAWNIDLGYLDGSDTVYFTVEQGASVTAGYTFNTRRPGKTYTSIGGTITAIGATTETGVDISSATIIDFTATGKLVAKGNMVNIFNTWALPANNQFRDRGIGAANPGWGTTSGILAAYDQASNTTRLTSIAGPICDAVYRLPGDENMDCVVDLKDFAVMAKNWMVCAWQPQEACQ